MTFIPYSDNCSRGQQTQNALSQTFARMGYKTTMKHREGHEPKNIADYLGTFYNPADNESLLTRHGRYACI